MENNAMNKRRNAKRTRRGFTLLEVLMVIVILGVLAALIVPQFAGTQEGAYKDLTATRIKDLRNKLEMFKLNCDRFPTSDEGLIALVQQPDDEELAEKWRGPYLDESGLKDAWGRELQYESPGSNNEGTFDLSSAGPNGQFGDEDDITNWEKTS